MQFAGRSIFDPAMGVIYSSGIRGASHDHPETNFSEEAVDNAGASAAYRELPGLVFRRHAEQIMLL